MDFQQCTTRNKRGVGFYQCTPGYKRFISLQLGIRETGVSAHHRNERNRGF
jgi:hypothetical protein